MDMKKEESHKLQLKEVLQKGRTSNEGDQKMMIPRRQQGAALTIVMFMLLVLVVMWIPLSPSLTVTLVIDTKPTPTLSVTSFSYEKVPLPTAWVTTRDVPYFVGLPTTTGDAALKVTIVYGTSLLSDHEFKDLGDGTYQIRVLYLPRSEEKSTPYVITLTLIYGGQTVSKTLNIFP